MGVAEDRISYINFENLEDEDLLNYKTLHAYLLSGELATLLAE